MSFFPEFFHLGEDIIQAAEDDDGRLIKAARQGLVRTWICRAGNGPVC
jgi:hypothetical protein